MLEDNLQGTPVKMSDVDSWECIMNHKNCQNCPIGYEGYECNIHGKDHNYDYDDDDDGGNGNDYYYYYYYCYCYCYCYCLLLLL